MSVRYIRFESSGWRDTSKPVPLAIAADLEGKFKPPDGCLLLAYDPDTPEKIIGSAGFAKIAEGVCEASRVVVGWDYQNKGVGQGLMAALMNEARQAGYHTMRIKVPADIDALVAFFTRLGFRQLSFDASGPSPVIWFETSLGRSNQ